MATFYNVYGPREPEVGEYATVRAKFQRQFDNNEPITVVGDGLQTRDFTHVDDVVRGTYLAWKKNLNREFMLGTGKLYSVVEIANLFNHKIKEIPSRSGERISSIKVNNDAYKILRYKPKIKIENYITNFVKNNKK
jgi:UDP-glucose 4-epimerase